MKSVMISTLNISILVLVILFSHSNAKSLNSNTRTIVLNDNSILSGIASVTCSPNGKYFVVHDSRMKAALYDMQGNLLRTWFYSDSLYGMVYGKKSDDYFRFIKNLTTPKHILKDKRLAALPLEKRQQIIENNKLAENLIECPVDGLIWKTDTVFLPLNRKQFISQLFGFKAFFLNDSIFRLNSVIPTLLLNMDTYDLDHKYPQKNAVLSKHTIVEYDISKEKETGYVLQKGTDSITQSAGYDVLVNDDDRYIYKDIRPMCWDGEDYECYDDKDYYNNVLGKYDLSSGNIVSRIGYIPHAYRIKQLSRGLYRANSCKLDNQIILSFSDWDSVQVWENDILKNILPLNIPVSNKKYFESLKENDGKINTAGKLKEFYIHNIWPEAKENFIICFYQKLEKSDSFLYVFQRYSKEGNLLQNKEILLPNKEAADAIGYITETGQAVYSSLDKDENWLLNIVDIWGDK